MTIQTKDSTQQSLSSRANANNIFTKNSDLGYLPFEDKRDIAIQQRKLIDIVNSKTNTPVTQLSPGKKTTPKKVKKKVKVVKKGKAAPKKGGGKKGKAGPKRPHFLNNVKKARKLANAMKTKKGIKIDMAHRMSWQKISLIIAESKGNPKNAKFLKMLKVVTVPNRKYGKIPKNSKILYNQILKIANSSKLGTNDPEVAKLLNSSIINLRPGNSKINRSIQEKNDYNHITKKKGKKFVRARSPISERLHNSFPDKKGSTKTSSFFTDHQTANWEKNVDN